MRPKSRQARDQELRAWKREEQERAKDPLWRYAYNQAITRSCGPGIAALLGYSY